LQANRCPEEAVPFEVMCAVEARAAVLVIPSYASLIANPLDVKSETGIHVEAAQQLHLLVKCAISHWSCGMERNE
jgi:hypothetical protein